MRQRQVARFREYDVETISPPSSKVRRQHAQKLLKSELETLNLTLSAKAEADLTDELIQLEDDMKKSHDAEGDQHQYEDCSLFLEEALEDSIARLCLQ